MPTTTARGHSEIIAAAVAGTGAIAIDSTTVLCPGGDGACPAFLDDGTHPVCQADGYHLSAGVRKGLRMQSPTSSSRKDRMIQKVKYGNGSLTCSASQKPQQRRDERLGLLLRQIMPARQHLPGDVLRPLAP